MPAIDLLPRRKLISAFGVIDGSPGRMLELANTFHRSLDRLTNAEQAAAKTMVFDYMADPSRPGLSLHRVDKARDKGFWTIRVNRDLRIVVFKQSQKSVFCYVGHHDDAYSWAAGRRFEVHPVTGAAQLVEFVEIVKEEIRVVAKQAPKPGILANEDPAYLLSLGIPESYLQLVRDVDDDGLLDLLPRLPEEAQESLMALATGERPEPRPVVSASLVADPFAHPDAQRRFWVASDEEAVAQALEKPWAEWLVFLHPSQRAAVERNFNGPARISGAAGTGKSVVAMHRAAHLARESQAGRILLTTFSKTLSARLSEGMDTLLGPASEARQRIEVIHLHAYAHGHVSRLTPLAVVDERTIDKLISGARGDLDPAISDVFLRAEWDAVIDFWGVTSLDEYRAVPRVGRGKALTARTRGQLWDVFENVRRQLNARKLNTFGEVCDRLRERIDADGLRPFRHVVVDEAQDLGPRELLPSRITEVDGEAEERGALSLLRGPEPEIRGSDELSGEIAVLVKWLNTVRERGVAPGEIAIFARTRRALQDRAEPALKQAGLVGAWLSPDHDFDSGKISLGTLHSAKGLEFRAVAVVACDDNHLPLKAAIDAATELDEKSVTKDRELSLLYVGCTRARDQLLITWSGPPSRFLASRLQSG